MRKVMKARSAKKSTLKESAAKPASSRKARGEAQLAEVAARLSQSAEKLTQAANRLTEAAARLSSAAAETRHESAEAQGQTPGTGAIPLQESEAPEVIRGQ
jgi:hypothetical protein